MITKREAIIDLSIVGTCCVVYIVAGLFRFPIIPVVSVVIAVLLFFVLVVLRQRNETWRDRGFRSDNLRQSALLVGTPTAIAAAAIIIWAAIQGRYPSVEWLVLTVLYLPWGICQQFIFQGIVQRRVRILISGNLIPITIATVTYAAVHLPNLNIVAMTLLAGSFWSLAFASCPNLWTVGLSHGLLGPMAYMLALGEQPMERFF